MGALYFDGKDVTDFIAHWEDLTIDWTHSQHIKKVSLYCEKLIGKYWKTFETYVTGTSWNEFRAALITEFKEDDIEQKKNTEMYLQSLVQSMRMTKDPSVARYRAFIFEFAERLTLLVSKLILNEHTRVFMFLQALSDKIGDKLCKQCNIDIDDTASTANVWTNLRQESLSICIKDDSQMSKLWKTKQQMESPTASPHAYDQTCVKQTQGKMKKDGKPPQTLDEVTSMMKELQLSQVEATKKLNEELAFLRDVFTKTPPKGPYYWPKQYGNREYPPAAMANPIRGCHWDRQLHLKEDCPDLKRVVERGDVHMCGKIVFLGQERLGDEIKVPSLSEVGRVVKWQKD